MGDVGALFLGLVLSAILHEIKGATAITVVVPRTWRSDFDTAFAILRRLVNKRLIMEADSVICIIG